MTNVISNDMRTFGICRLLLATTSIAVGCALINWFGELAYLIGAAIVLFWLSNLLFMVSDWLDPRPVDKKSVLASIVNVVGLISMICAQVAGILGVCCLALALLVYCLRL